MADQTQQQIASLQRQVAKLQEIVNHHKHDGVDGSAKLAFGIDLKDGEEFTVANSGGFTAGQDGPTQVASYTFGAGIDSNPADGNQNAQVILQHQYGTNGSTNQTFMFGIRSPLFGGTNAFTTSGGTTMNQSTYQWDTNVVAGARIQVNDGVNFNEFLIDSNTQNQLTISGGTWSFGGSNLNYVIFVPIYLGSADFPWRRVYSGDDTTGGIRFGFGPTNGGQNGLLFTDPSDGLLYYRTYAGVVHQVHLV